MTELKQVTIYTDGACIGNPGPGGYGAIITCNGTRKELSGGFRLTTNNRMEITAAITGLRELTEKCKVTLYSDSEYLVKAVSLGWAEKWRSKSWMRNKSEKALNPDLWEELLTLCGRHEVEFRWVRGHAGNAANERCDVLAMKAAKTLGLPADKGYKS